MAQHDTPDGAVHWLDVLQASPWLCSSCHASPFGCVCVAMQALQMHSLLKLQHSFCMCCHEKLHRHLPCHASTIGCSCHAGTSDAQPAEAAAGPSAEAAAQPAEESAPEEDAIDPEFLAALPPEIQAEVLEQQRRERRMRQRQRQQQQQAAAAAAQVLHCVSHKLMVTNLHAGQCCRFMHLCC